MKKSITKIVITGGPCSGKTTSHSKIEEEFSRRGYKTVIISETATELITGGVTAGSMDCGQKFQEVLMSLQLSKEAAYEKAASSIREQKILIVCDRGALDSKAYMSDKEFASVLAASGVNEVNLRDDYDAVFHLVTAAKGSREFYTLKNNPARTESPEKAAALDDKIIHAWTGHPHLRIIDNSTDFEGKLKRLLHEISIFLGEPEPFEIEKKFLIEYPDLLILTSMPNCTHVEIIQTYLINPDEHTESRIRQRGTDGNYIYVRTDKRSVSDIKRIETENRISKDEYLALLMNADTARKQIRKTRYLVAYGTAYLEIDVYPFSNSKAILEIELSDESQEFTFPPFLKMVKEVTTDERFKNYSLSKGIPIEFSATTN